MADLGDLIAQREALAKARASGVRVIGIGPDRVEFKSDAEMKAALDDLDARIGGALRGTPISAVRIRTSRGV